MKYKVRSGFLENRFFDTLEEAVNHIYYPNGDRRWTSFEDRVWYADSCQLVEDVHIQQVIGNLKREMHERQLRYIRKRLGRYEFRNGPVAYTGKRRGRRNWGSYHRKPRYKQELINGRQNIRTYWDDTPRHTERCWKKQRKTQWK